MAGYSGTPLMGKLGYKPGESVFTLQVPDWLIDEIIKQTIGIRSRLPATWAHAFFTAKKDVQLFCERTDLAQIEKALWVSWPKKSSGVRTDLTEQTFRDEILPLGWVDIKVATIDDTWSGLKFTRRKA